MHLNYTEILPTIAQENIRNLEKIPLISFLSLSKNIQKRHDSISKHYNQIPLKKSAKTISMIFSYTVLKKMKLI